MEDVLGMIYMSVGVRVRLLHRQIYTGERCIAGFILTENILVKEAAVFRRSNLVWRHARQRRWEWWEVLPLAGVVRIRCR